MQTETSRNQVEEGECARIKGFAQVNKLMAPAPCAWNSVTCEKHNRFTSNDQGWRHPHDQRSASLWPGKVCKLYRSPLEASGSDGIPGLLLTEAVLAPSFGKVFNTSIVKFGQRLFTTHPHVSDYVLLKTRMGGELENRWQIELLQRFGEYTFFRELVKGSELT